MTASQTTNEIEARVEELLRQLSLAEKVSLLSGRDSWGTMPVDRLGIPGLIMTDGPHGVRANQPDAGRAVSGTTTAFPTGSAMASTWNPALVQQAARALGEETKAMGCDILLGPCVNIMRTPLAGRNFESYSEDPYLAGRIGIAYVNGVQSAGAGTSLKHYAANNQETERFRGSSEVDERTLREIYLAQFEAIVKEANPWTVMCSYNRINGVYASQHHHLLTEILKDEWGYDGVVVSDWTANHTTVDSVRGGLDLEMPGPARWYGSLLIEAVNLWQIEEAEIDKAARRVIRMALRSGKMDGKAPGESFSPGEESSPGESSSPSEGSTPAHQALARQVAEEAVVLLKNRGGLLPLKPQSLQTLAVIGGAAADMTISGGGSSYTVPPYTVSPLQALRERVGQQVEVVYEQGADNWLDLPVLKPAYLTPAQGEGFGLTGEYWQGAEMAGQPACTRLDPRLDFFWFSAGPHVDVKGPFSARWTGKLQVPEGGRYTMRLHNTGAAWLYVDGRLLVENNASESKDFHDITYRDGVLELEGGRAYDLRLELKSTARGQFTHVKLAFGATPQQDDRIARAVEAARAAEAALVFAGATEGFETEGIDRPHIRLTGRQDELIRAVAAANPNTVVVLNVGAPVEMPWIDDVAAVVLAHFPGLEGGAAVTNVLTGAVNPSGKLTVTYPRRLEDTSSHLNLALPNARQVRYGEGLYVGYRYHDKSGAAPLFPFGHGLSYTSFTYSGLRLPESVSAGVPVEVTFTVENSGPAAGKEVAQVYVRDVESSVDRPVKELKGFAKIDLQPGQRQAVTITLDRRAFAFYDVLRRDWVVEPGEFEVVVGASSADIRLVGTVLLR